MFAGTHVLIKQLNQMANAELCFACLFATLKPITLGLCYLNMMLARRTN